MNQAKAKWAGNVEKPEFSFIIRFSVVKLLGFKIRNQNEF
jgi:hypothetical protein